MNKTKITIENLIALFIGNTKFYLQNPNNETDRFNIGDSLLKIQSFASIELSFREIKSTGENEIVIKIFDMSNEVYNMWKELNQKDIEKRRYLNE